VLFTLAPTIHTYDLNRFNFPEAVASVIGTGGLDSLPCHPGRGVFTRERDQSTIYHTSFYERFQELRQLYVAFIEHVIASVLTESFCFQSIPTLRVHLPQNVAVGEFHTDGDYGHPVGEVNFWVPLTPAWSTNSIWIEKAPGTADYDPVELSPGHFLMFDAVQWSHGNVVNETGCSRVSFDFRCIPLSRYVHSDARSVNAQRKLIIGDYFEVLDVANGDSILESEGNDGS
jgi:hypothetical protein